MNEPAWSEIQRPGVIGSYVLPLMVGTLRPADEHPLCVESVEGTGFLVAGGRGLGITAGHVARSLLGKAPVPDLSTLVAEITDLRVPGTGFIDEGGKFRNSPVCSIDLHPTEDVALFRLPDGDYYSPYTVSADKREASAFYSVWGYPDEVRHDYLTEEEQLLNVPLVYSGGHIRRRLNREIPEPGPRGRSFYELSAPAGSCCSGAPVSLRRDPWRAIGVYVGERRNESGFAVGFATRTDALAQQWPQLVDPAGDLSELCHLPPPR
jgi:hypothetical protein